MKYLFIFLMCSSLHANQLSYSAGKVAQCLHEDKQVILYMANKESGSNLDMMYNLNLPGVYLPPLKKTTKTFSIDYSFAGINEVNVRWTYEVAKALQLENDYKRKRELRRLKVKYSLKSTFINALFPRVIPAEIELFRLNTGKRLQIALESTKLEKRGLSPLEAKNRLESHLNVNQEHSYNEIESCLIYRVLVEEERKARGWKAFEENYP